MDEGNTFNGLTPGGSVTLRDIRHFQLTSSHVANFLRKNSGQSCHAAWTNTAAFSPARGVIMNQRALLFLSLFGLFLFATFSEKCEDFLRYVNDLLKHERIGDVLETKLKLILFSVFSLMCLQSKFRNIFISSSASSL